MSDDKSTIWLAIEAGVYGPGRDKRPEAYAALERLAARLASAEEALASVQGVCDEAMERALAAEAALQQTRDALGTCEYALMTGAQADITEALDVCRMNLAPAGNDEVVPPGDRSHRTPPGTTGARATSLPVSGDGGNTGPAAGREGERT